MNLVEKFVALLSWVQIMIAPFSGGVIIGFIIWGNNQNTMGLSIGIGFAVLGLVLGILWAEKIRRKNGTMNFIAKARGSPELDDPKIYEDDAKQNIPDSSVKNTKK